MVIDARLISIVFLYFISLFELFNKIITIDTPTVTILSNTSLIDAKSIGIKIDVLNDNNSVIDKTNTLNKQDPKILPNPASKLPFAQRAIVETTSGRDVATAKNKTPAVDAVKLKILARSFVTYVINMLVATNAIEQPTNLTTICLTERLSPFIGLSIDSSLSSESFLGIL